MGFAEGSVADDDDCNDDALSNAALPNIERIIAPAICAGVAACGSAAPVGAAVRSGVC